MKLKEKHVDLNDKYKAMQKENCCLKLESSYLHYSKNKLTSEKQLFEKSFTYVNLISREAYFQGFLWFIS